MRIGLRTKLLLPSAVLAALLGAYLVVFDPGAPLTPGLLIATLIVMMGVMATNAEVLVLRPLRRLAQETQDLARSGLPAPPVEADPGQMRELAQGIDRLRGRMRDYEANLSEERRLRQALEENVRALEDRYALTVERANDGIWEWNLKSGAVDFSLRWKGMLGLSDATIQRIEDWQVLLHPEEKAAIVKRLADHISGLTPRFDEEYRLRQSDGRYRWVHSRGTAIRHASGKAYRAIMMDNDIHARRELEEALIQAAEGLSALTGNDFYQALLRCLSSILGTRDNLVCYCVGDPPIRARTLAYYSTGKFWENFEYDLAGTSCGDVIDRRETVYCPTGVCDIWPEEKQYDRDSYLGVPMFDSAGKIIGHFACMDGNPMRQDLPHLALFKIFSVRAAAELERTLLLQKIGTSPATT